MSPTVWSLPPQSQLHFGAKYDRRVRERSGNVAVSAVRVTGQPVKADSLSQEPEAKEFVMQPAWKAGRRASQCASRPCCDSDAAKCVPAAPGFVCEASASRARPARAVPRARWENESDQDGQYCEPRARWVRTTEYLTKNGKLTHL